MQVIINLIDPAIHSTNPGGQVQVSLSNSDTAAHVVIRDTEIGITSEHLLHIFERFYRGGKKQKDLFLLTQTTRRSKQQPFSIPRSERK